jgi:hypothetical protein
MIGLGKFIHYHYLRYGSGIKQDWVNDRALSTYEKDREMFNNKLKQL